MRPSAFDALCTAFAALDDSATGGWTIHTTRRVGTAPQLVLRSAGGKRHPELDLYDPFVLQIVAYHTSQRTAYARIEALSEHCLGLRSQGGEEHPWELTGWRVRDTHLGVPTLIEMIPVTDDEIIYGVALVAHFVLTPTP